MPCTVKFAASNFNPRPPHGGRHTSQSWHCVPTAYFNPRPPHGGRPLDYRGIVGAPVISIHALLTEGDVFAFSMPFGWEISIHALLTEGDIFLPHGQRVDHDFNPRPPHGGRLSHLTKADRYKIISIHALLTEGDRPPHTYQTKRKLFQSTPSSRRATAILHKTFLLILAFICCICMILLFMEYNPKNSALCPPFFHQFGANPSGVL